MKYPLRVQLLLLWVINPPWPLPDNPKYGNVLNWLSFLITLDYRLRLSDIRKLLVYSLVPFPSNPVAPLGTLSENSNLAIERLPAFPRGRLTKVPSLFP